MKKLFSSLASVSLEEESNPQSLTSKETEVAIYCKISNPESLKEAERHEVHHQYMTSFQGGDKCRVRMTIADNGQKTYDFTIKTKDPENEETTIETTTQVDGNFLDVFKKNAEILVIKQRYVFHGEAVKLTFQEGDQIREIQLPDVKYEVDVFEDKNGKTAEWAKIDLELDVLLDFISKNHPDLKDIKLSIKISHLPFKPTDAIIDREASKQEKDFIDKLWKEVYNNKV